MPNISAETYFAIANSAFQSEIGIFIAISCHLGINLIHHEEHEIYEETTKNLFHFYLCVLLDLRGSILFWFSAFEGSELGFYS